MNYKKYGLPDNNVINSALKLAIESHRGEKRTSNNEPYVNHPIRVAQTIYLLSQFKDNMKTIASAILHDTVENCGLNEAVFINRFGEEDGKIIYANVTPLSVPVNITDNNVKNEWQLNHMSLLSPGQQAIKLADRKDNVETLPGSWTTDRKLKYIIHSQNLLTASSDEIRVSALGMECGRTFQAAIYNYSPAADEAKAYVRKGSSFFSYFRRIAILGL